MLNNAKWIKNKFDFDEVCPIFTTQFYNNEKVKKATIQLTSLGVYEAYLNGGRIGNYVMAPGYTSYEHRLQYQEYDITALLNDSRNNIEITVAKGWYHSRLGWDVFLQTYPHRQQPLGLIASITLTYLTGETEVINTESTWKCKRSHIKFCELYDGVIYDASYTDEELFDTEIFDGPTDTLIPQQGDTISEQEVIYPKSLIITPKGEHVLDFGQNLTGYIEISLTAKNGDQISLSHGEILDKDGNFYNENYRSAKAMYHYTCCDGFQTYKPSLTFYGFRYIRIDAYPASMDTISLAQFRAIVIHSNLKRTGSLVTSNTQLNQLIENTIWGQKGNFVDIPTDCPQRDERLGWTGDAQAFVKTAAYNFDVERFFTKWLADLSASQGDNGYIPHVIPNIYDHEECSSAWGDACTICPWEIYLAYGNRSILANQFHSMKCWVDYITTHTTQEYLWTGGQHFGDWLGLDAPSGSYKGASRDDFIASAFYAHSTNLLIKAGHVLQEDMTEYETLYTNIVNTFKNVYSQCTTQTECILALHFHLTDHEEDVVKLLVDKIHSCGLHLETGFVGTPYLLHVLSSHGYSDIAYQLLLRTDYPSWLYPVTKGATTIWEHWDGIVDSGNLWSSDMNSYNHYAYGAVVDWIYSVSAGIQPLEEYPGYQKVKIAPVTNSRLTWLKGSLQTKYGLIRSEWKLQEGQWRYEIETPVDSIIIIGSHTYEVSKGTYTFYSDLTTD